MRELEQRFGVTRQSVNQVGIVAGMGVGGVTRQSVDQGGTVEGGIGWGGCGVGWGGVGMLSMEVGVGRRAGG
jgi:hypothetical protein